MILARAIIFGVPLGALALTWWSVQQARASRTIRESEIVAMLPGPPPALNPFVPATEVDRQIVDLLHEPLIRIGADGRLKPALAERWEWSQTVTCWFASPDAAIRAAAHLKEVNSGQRITWGLESASANQGSLVMHFSKMGSKGPDAVAAESAAFSPLTAEVIRVELNEPVRPYHEHFAAHAVHAAQIKRAWFDGANALEIVVAGDVPKFAEELTNYYRSKTTLKPRIENRARITALREPVLDFVLREDGRWNDGTPVTAEDVRATHSYVMAQPWPVTNREALRDVLTIESVGKTRLRVLYRRESGAALCGWIGLPILPASWFHDHPADAEGHVFTENSPPGAGIFTITHRDLSSLALAAADGGRKSCRIRRATFASGASPFQTKLGFATGETDMFWPENNDVPSLVQGKDLAIRSLPPRGRLLVVWNTRSTVLSSVHAREALSLATDRTALVNELLQGRGRIQEGLFQPGLWFAQKFPPPLFDLDAAKAKLEVAGWLRDVEGMAKRPGQRFAFELLTTEGNEQRRKLATALAEQWRKIGADVKVTAVPWNDFIEKRLSRRQFDAAIIGLDFETTWDQSAFWHSSQAAGAGLNFSGIADRQIDLLLEELRQEFDPERVPEKAKELEDKLLAQQPMLPLFTDMQQVEIRTTALPVGEQTDEVSAWTLRDFVLDRPASAARPKVALPEMRVPDENPVPPAQGR